jgi:hypothetical protein
MSLWHVEARIGVVLYKGFKINATSKKDKILTSELVHHEHSQVLVADVKNEIWSSLINFLWDVTLLKHIESVVAVSHKMSINEIEWVPSPVNFSAIGLRLPIGVECFVHEIVDVEVKILVETFFGHILSKTANEPL